MSVLSYKQATLPNEPSQPTNINFITKHFITLSAIMTSHHIEVKRKNVL